MTIATFPALLQRFFTDRLLGQLGASPHTVASYRDTFRILICFASERIGRPPCELRLEDFSAAFLGQFLEHLQRDRGNGTRTRNTRLAAVRAFFRYVSFTEPSHALDCQRVLAIPTKRHDHRPVAFLVEAEVRALVDFREINLVDPGQIALLGQFDVVFCRNVLLYFDRAARKRVVASFHERLTSGGYLLLGHSESLLNLSNAFELAQLRNDTVYRKP